MEITLFIHLVHSVQNGGQIQYIAQKQNNNILGVNYKRTRIFNGWCKISFSLLVVILQSLQSHLGWVHGSLECLYSPTSYHPSFLIPLWISLFPGISAPFWGLFFLLAVSGDGDSRSLWTLIVTIVDYVEWSICKTSFHLSVLMLFIGYHQYSFTLRLYFQ